LGWHRWVGDDGEIIALDRFGASAPAGTIFEQLGFTAENVYLRASALLDKPLSATVEVTG
jgi:transketolase